MSGVCPDCLVRGGHSGVSLTRLPVVSGMLDAVLQQAKGRCAHVGNAAASSASETDARQGIRLEGVSDAGIPAIRRLDFAARHVFKVGVAVQILREVHVHAEAELIPAASKVLIEAIGILGIGHAGRGGRFAVKVVEVGGANEKRSHIVRAVDAGLKAHACHVRVDRILFDRNAFRRAVVFAEDVRGREGDLRLNVGQAAEREAVSGFNRQRKRLRVVAARELSGVDGEVEFIVELAPLGRHVDVGAVFEEPGAVARQRADVVFARAVRKVCVSSRIGERAARELLRAARADQGVDARLDAVVLVVDMTGFGFALLLVHQPKLQD